jgi:hypothetical protein
MDDLVLFLELTVVAVASCGLAHAAARLCLTGLLRVLAGPEANRPRHGAAARRYR